MTPDEVNRFLAVEVMGWREHHGHKNTYGGRVPVTTWIDADSPPESEWTYKAWPETRAGEHWNPYHSIADAMRVFDRVADQCHESSIHKINGKYYAGFVTDGYQAVIEDHAAPSTAIALAAVEWVKAKASCHATPSR